MTTISRPNRPTHVVLSPAAKHALTTAKQFTLNGPWYVAFIAVTPADDNTHEELSSLGLIQADHTTIHTQPNHWCYAVTDNGLRMRSYLKHQFHLGQLAKQIRAENITGEDIADLAAGIDAGEETGSITGTSVDFQLAFALVASHSGQSAEDLRQDLARYMG